MRTLQGQRRRPLHTRASSSWHRGLDKEILTTQSRITRFLQSKYVLDFRIVIFRRQYYQRPLFEGRPATCLSHRHIVPIRAQQQISGSWRPANEILGETAPRGRVWKAGTRTTLAHMASAGRAFTFSGPTIGYPLWRGDMDQQQVSGLIRSASIC